VAVDHVTHFEFGQMDFSDSRHLIVEFVPIETLLGPDVSEYPVSLPLPNIERLSISRIDQSVDVRPQFGYDRRRK